MVGTARPTARQIVTACAPRMPRPEPDAPWAVRSAAEPDTSAPAYVPSLCGNTPRARPQGTHSRLPV